MADSEKTFADASLEEHGITDRAGPAHGCCPVDSVQSPDADVLQLRLQGFRFHRPLSAAVRGQDDPGSRSRPRPIQSGRFESWPPRLYRPRGDLPAGRAGEHLLCDMPTTSPSVRKTRHDQAPATWVTGHAAAVRRPQRAVRLLRRQHQATAGRPRPVDAGVKFAELVVFRFFRQLPNDGVEMIKRLFLIIFALVLSANHMGFDDRRLVSLQLADVWR